MRKDKDRSRLQAETGGRQMKPVKAWAVIRAWDDGRVAFILPSARPLIFKTRRQAERENYNENWSGDIVHIEIREVKKRRAK